MNCPSFCVNTGDCLPYAITVFACNLTASLIKRCLLTQQQEIKMKIRNLLIQCGLALGCAIVIAGCSVSPSANDAEQVLRQQVDSESGGQIKLVNFKKTDGQKFELSGIQGYIMAYEA